MNSKYSTTGETTDENCHNLLKFYLWGDDRRIFTMPVAIGLLGYIFLLLVENIYHYEDTN
ncbi:MAG: hypothetical protein ACKO9I_16060 [Sphaerospermopsis kisseleviana]|uniref:Uncharacterized protein n=2 Tax=Sphaerospermopsis TaxID=752201 RepID=A0ABR9VDC1_9CYAN|nr:MULTISPECIES: hypothetical protein [Sphaerospermopsis]MBD2131903.1 hypothetical protein [Sphaerospermopsis sp. FACHB-1094]MBD2143905.1 hypothetical protein [Sphaerospermopsis sp. FACHB-1194]MBE9235712.1 hypothetical protein [Sphaerospermopsis aphanizomenoides LEGE 00250]